jgi:hypothetical protein
MATRFPVPTWFKEPLFIFLLLGGALFALEPLVFDRSDDGAAQRIDITPKEIGWLADTWASRWQRPPTEDELRGLVDDYVRTEVFYRRALAMGLDRDDEVIRRRMVQKIEFLTEGLAAQVQPTEAQLQEFLQTNLEDYLVPEQRSFAHVYFNPDRHERAELDRLVTEAARMVRSTPPAELDLPELGDGFLLPHEVADISEYHVARQFGREFAADVFALAPGVWHGPIDSGFGRHLVFVTAVSESVTPDLADVRSEVTRDYLHQAKQRAKDSVYESLAEEFEITVDEEAVRAAALAAPAAGEDR